MPLHKANLIHKDLGGEFLIYSSERKEIHIANQTAQLIWDLCDGKHSINDMEQEIRAHFSVPPERDIMGDIQNTLDIFRNKGLLEYRADLDNTEISSLQDE